MPILFERDGHIATVKLNEPKTRNALGPDTLMQLNNAWDECQADSNIRVIVLTSAVDDVFCAGMNLKTAIPVLTGARPPETEEEKWLASDWRAASRALLKYRELDRPVIAAVNGYCLTGGFELVMGCELRLATENAVFQMREARLGIMPTGGSNIYLQQQLGHARAMEILLTGNNMPAKTLLEWGFLNRVVPKANLLDTAYEFAERIASNGPRAVRGIVRCSRDIVGKAILEAMDLESELGVPVFNSDQAREGVLAQEEKRRANFR